MASQQLDTPPSSSGPARSASVSYIPGLDGIRAIAFLMVFGFHLTVGTRAERFFPGALGVTIFFFLSGFLITTLLRKEIARTGTVSLKDFYFRRALRIFVPLYLVYALTELFDRLYLHGTPANALGFFSTVFYFFNYATLFTTHANVPAGLGVAWSLSVEEHFYIVFPLLYLAMLRRSFPRRKQIAVLFGLCIADLAWRFALALIFKDRAADWCYIATDARFDSILWGSLLAVANNPVFGDPSILPPRWKFPAFAVASFVLLSPLRPHAVLYQETLRSTIQGLALYCMFSFILANIEHWSVSWLEWLPLRYVGWTSYVLYLTHDTILGAIKPLLRGHLVAIAIAGLACSLAFATLFRYAVELPLQNARATLRNRLF